jgi:hypothetical protein
MYLSIFDDKPNLDEIDFPHAYLKKYSFTNLDGLNNLIFYGIKGSGKTTKVYAFLCSLLNDKVYDIKTQTFESDNKCVQYKSSIYHIEIDALELLTGERVFFSDFLKEYCETRNIGLDLPKIIYIKNAEHLNKLSFLFLRKLIEKSFLSSRFIFEMTSVCGVPDPLLSRFFIVRINMPSLPEIHKCLKNYLSRKGKYIEDNVITQLIEKSKRTNIYDLKSIFGFVRYYLVTGKFFEFFYDQYQKKILEIIFNKNLNMNEVNSLKGIIEDMFVNLIDSRELILNLNQQIFNKLQELKIQHDDLKMELIQIALKHDLNIKRGNKEFVHVLNYIIDVIDCIHTKNILSS